MHATGLFAAADEASQVLKEIVGLRYTAAQLRFAFVLLLELEAAPVRLYNAFEHDMMRDFLHAGLSAPTAKTRLKDVLRTAWVHSGHSDHDWPLGGTCKLEAQSAAPDQADGAATPASFKERVLADTNQRTVFEHVTGCLQGHPCSESAFACAGPWNRASLHLLAHLHSAFSFPSPLLHLSPTSRRIVPRPCSATAVASEHARYTHRFRIRRRPLRHRKSTLASALHYHCQALSKDVIKVAPTGPLIHPPIQVRPSLSSSFLSFLSFGRPCRSAAAVRRHRPLHVRAPRHRRANILFHFGTSIGRCGPHRASLSGSVGRMARVSPLLLGGCHGALRHIAGRLRL